MLTSFALNSVYFSRLDGRTAFLVGDWASVGLAARQYHWFLSLTSLVHARLIDLMAKFFELERHFPLYGC